MKQKHTLEYLKRQAKKLKKEHGITHTEALERLARENGYANWIECQRLLRPDGAHPIHQTK